jgi:hypothetical protein
MGVPATNRLLWNEMAIMREMGEEGWELAGVWGLFLYFKRALPA